MMKKQIYVEPNTAVAVSLRATSRKNWSILGLTNEKIRIDKEKSV
jgi:hypothetical protein